MEQNPSGITVLGLVSDDYKPLVPKGASEVRYQKGWNKNLRALDQAVFEITKDLGLPYIARNQDGLYADGLHVTPDAMREFTRAAINKRYVAVAESPPWKSHIDANETEAAGTSFAAEQYTMAVHNINASDQEKLARTDRVLYKAPVPEPTIDV